MDVIITNDLSNRPLAVISHMTKNSKCWMAKILSETTEQRNAKPEWFDDVFVVLI